MTDTLYTIGLIIGMVIGGLGFGTAITLLIDSVQELIKK